MNLESLVEKFESERFISLIEYAQELTENDFEFILEFFKSFDCDWCVIDLNSNQEIKFNESKFKEEINSLMNSNKERWRLYDNLPRGLPRGGIKEEIESFKIHGIKKGCDGPRIYIPRKGMVYLDINEKNAEFLKPQEERKNKQKWGRKTNKKTSENFL